MAFPLFGIEWIMYLSIFMCRKINEYNFKDLVIPFFWNWVDYWDIYIYIYVCVCVCVMGSNYTWCNLNRVIPILNCWFSLNLVASKRLLLTSLIYNYYLTSQLILIKFPHIHHLSLLNNHLPLIKKRKKKFLFSPPTSNSVQIGG